jgi:ABC-type phosphate transport system substrate-binding protein
VDAGLENHIQFLTVEPAAMKNIFLKTGLVGAVLLAGVLPAAARDDLVIIANKSVPLDHLSAASLRDIYIGKSTYWPDGQSVVIAVQTEPTGEADAVLKKISGMDASHFATFWQRMVFSGRGNQPKNVEDAAALAALVAATKGAIAVVPADVQSRGVKLIEIK